DHSTERRRESVTMTFVDYLDASAVDRRVVERGPNLQLRIAIETPEAPAVLVPREQGSARRRFSEDERAVDRDVAFGHAPRDLLEERVLDPGAKNRIDLELLDLSIVEARALPATTERQIVVAAGRRIELEEEARIRDSPEHQIV